MEGIFSRNNSGGRPTGAPMTISGVSGNGAARFSREEEDALQKNESTSGLLNKAKSAAGQRDGDVAVRGDDVTLDEHLRGYKTHVPIGETGSAAVHAVEIATALKLIKLGAGASVALPAAAWVATQVALAEMQNEKDGRKAIATRDVMHAALVQSLDVPQGFRDSEISRLGVTMSAQSPAKKIADQIAMNDGARATLQLHCDQGMNEARGMIDAGIDKTAFLKANPKIAERYGSDAAFKNGFDAMVWAKNESPATYADTVAKLESRDARYSASQVQYRL